MPAERLHQTVCLGTLFLFVILGTLFTFFLPPFQVPDEVAHWETAVYRSQIFPGRDRPVCSVSYALPVVLEVDSIRFHPDDKFHTGNFARLGTAKAVCAQFPMGYGSVWTYSPVALLHWLFGSAHGDARVGLRVFYASRWLHGVFLAFLSWRLLRAARARTSRALPGVLSILLVTISPLYVQQGFAISADVVVNAFCLSAVTLLVAGRSIGVVDWLLFTLTGAVAVTTKPVILPVALLFPLASVWWPVSSAPAGESHRRARVKPMLVATAVALSILCLAYVVFGVSAEQLDTHLPNVDARAQAAFVRTHPRIAVAAILGRALEAGRLSSYVGPLGWRDTPVSPLVGDIWQSLLWASLVLDACFFLRSARRWARERRSLARPLALLSLLLLGILSSVLVTVFIVYCTWSRVGARVVMGVQQRYFFPHLIVVLGLLPGLLRADEDVPDPSAAPPSSPLGPALSAAVAIGFIAIGVAYLVSIAGDLAVRYW